MNQHRHELASHHAWLRRLARRLARSPSRAEDLVQETCVTALRNAPPDVQLRPWLRSVMRKLAWGEVRSERRRAEREQAFGTRRQLRHRARGRVQPGQLQLLLRRRGGVGNHVPLPGHELVRGRRGRRLALPVVHLPRWCGRAGLLGRERASTRSIHGATRRPARARNLRQRGRVHDLHARGPECHAFLPLSWNGVVPLRRLRRLPRSLYPERWPGVETVQLAIGPGAGAIVAERGRRYRG
jgi:Sigma-70 region 2